MTAPAAAGFTTMSKTMPSPSASARRRRCPQHGILETPAQRGETGPSVAASARRDREDSRTAHRGAEHGHHDHADDARGDPGVVAGAVLGDVAPTH